MEPLVWRVKVTGAPMILHRCGKCGCERFVSSGRFRVNANGSRIDVWLIFKCERCNATWNMDILSRVRTGSIGAAHYRSFLNNDAATTLRYALDRDTLYRNGVVLDSDALMLNIDGPLPLGGADTRVVIKSTAPLHISVARVIAQKLGISKGAVRRMEAAGLLECTGGVRKVNLNTDVAFTLRAGWKNG